jgi:thiol-disulfide isomerase/thioredoxin
MKKLLILLGFLSFYHANAQDIPVWKGSDLTRYIENAPGEVAVINMWATFCKPCIAEIPGMIEVQKEFGDKVSLILVSVDMKSMYPKKLQQFLTKHRFDAPVVWLNETNADYFCPLLDPEWSGSIPATLILNKRTGYRKCYVEVLSKNDFLKAVHAAMK